MSPEQKRAAITRVYPGDTWQERVEKMSDSQVSAIYLRLLDKGKLDT